MTTSDLEAELARLAALPLAELRGEWRRIMKAPPPRVSRDLLIRSLGHQMQVAIHGDVPAETWRMARALAKGAKAAAVRPSPGTQLVREWRGVAHVVSVGADGRYQWNDRDWKSLSAIARAITGTRWSGPAFFGLRS